MFRINSTYVLFVEAEKHRSTVDALMKLVNKCKYQFNVPRKEAAILWLPSTVARNEPCICEQVVHDATLLSSLLNFVATGGGLVTLL